MRKVHPASSETLRESLTCCLSHHHETLQTRALLTHCIPIHEHQQGAQELAQKEPMLGGFLYSKILNQPTFERSLAFLLATKLANSTILASQWNDLIIDAITSSADEEKTNKWKKVAPGSGSIADAARADLEAIKLRDPACPSYVHAFLFYKDSKACRRSAFRIGCGVMVAPSSHALCSLTFPKLLVWIYTRQRSSEGES